jgi:hypothetical protein
MTSITINSISISIKHFKLMNPFNSILGMPRCEASCWTNGQGSYTLIKGLNVPLIKNDVVHIRLGRFYAVEVVGIRCAVSFTAPPLGFVQGVNVMIKIFSVFSQFSAKN